MRKKSAQAPDEAPEAAQSNLNRIRRIVSSLSELNSESVDPALWNAFVAAGDAVVASCISSDSAETLLSTVGPDGIPAGFLRCRGECQRILRISDANFRKDASKTLGYRSTCKECQRQPGSAGFRMHLKRESLERSEPMPEKKKLRSTLPSPPDMNDVSGVELIAVEQIPGTSVECVEEKLEHIVVESLVSMDQLGKLVTEKDLEKGDDVPEGGSADEVVLPGSKASQGNDCSDCEEEVDLLTNVYFSSSKCPWKVHPIEGDGLCLFRSIWEWLHLEEHRLKKLSRRYRNLNGFVSAVAGWAIDLLEEEKVQSARELTDSSRSGRPQRASQMDSEENKCIAVWKKIRSNPHELRTLWSDGAIDYAWDALRRGEPWIWVDVMEFAEADILVVKQSYPEPEDRVKARRPFACDILTVLRTAEDDVEHYDLLVATANNFQLHKDGFQVFRGEFPVKESTVDTLKRVYLDTPELAEEIFNNSDAGGSVNDGRRLQLPFSKLVDVPEAVELQELLAAEMLKRFPLRRPSDLVMLVSESGCQRQREHSDYTQANLLRVGENDDRMPLACIIALQDGTTIDVWPGSIRWAEKKETENDSSTFNKSLVPLKVTLNRGDVLFFRGDLVHAGAASTLFNIRLHIYLDVDGVSGSANYTFYMHEDACVLPRV